MGGRIDCNPVLLSRGLRKDLFTVFPTNDVDRSASGLSSVQAVWKMIPPVGTDGKMGFPREQFEEYVEAVPNPRGFGWKPDTDINLRHVM